MISAIKVTGESKVRTDVGADSAVTQPIPSPVSWPIPKSPTTTKTAPLNQLFTIAGQSGLQ